MNKFCNTKKILFFSLQLLIAFQSTNISAMNDDGWEVVSKSKRRKTNRKNFTNKVSNQNTEDRNKTRSEKIKRKKTKLTQAAFDGKLEQVISFVNNGVSVNQVDEEGQTALSWAAGEGHLEIVKFLLDNDAEINKRDGHDYTALDWACFNNKTEVVEFLLVRDADIHGERMSTLKTVAMRGDSHFEIFEILINHVMETKQFDLLTEQDEDSDRDILLWILRKYPNAPGKKHGTYDIETFYKYFNFLIDKCGSYLNFEIEDKFYKNAVDWLKIDKEYWCIKKIKNTEKCIN